MDQQTMFNWGSTILAAHHHSSEGPHLSTIASQSGVGISQHAQHMGVPEPFFKYIDPSVIL